MKPRDGEHPLGQHRGRPARERWRDMNFAAALVPLGLGLSSSVRGVMELSAGRLFGLLWLLLGISVLAVTGLVLRRV